MKPAPETSRRPDSGPNPRRAARSHPAGSRAVREARDRRTRRATEAARRASGRGRALLGLWLPLLLLVGCTVGGLTALNPWTGEQRTFEREDQIPDGWILCASPHTCPAPRACEELDEAACLTRGDCTPSFFGRGPYPRECELPDAPAVCDGEGFAGCFDARSTCEPAECGPEPDAPAFLCPDGSIGGNTGRCLRQRADGCAWEFRDCPDPAPAECPPDECGPAPGIPSSVCEDGSIGGNTGRCLRLADGRCGWEIRACPGPDPDPTCTFEECGPASEAPVYLCPDGSLGGNLGLCARNPDGVCGWVFRECPPTPRECAPEDCPGPAPDAPNGLCDDGSLGGPACEASSTGTCGWVIRTCPDPEPACPMDCGAYCAQANDCTLPATCDNPGCRCSTRTCP